MVINHTPSGFYESPEIMQNWFYDILTNYTIAYNWSPDLVVFNTIMWANVIAGLPLFKIRPFKIIFLLHEGELYKENRLGKNGFFYSEEFPVILEESFWLRADRVWFVSETVCMYIMYVVFIMCDICCCSVCNHYCTYN